MNGMTLDGYSSLQLQGNIYMPNKPLSKGPNIDEIHMDQRDGFLV